MIGLIKLAASATVTLGLALSNCGAPAGHTANIKSVDANCESYSFEFQGFPADDNIRIKQTVNAKLEGGDWFNVLHTSDDSLLQTRGYREHLHQFNLGGGGGGQRTMNVFFEWVDAQGYAKHHFITSALNC